MRQGVAALAVPLSFLLWGCPGQEQICRRQAEQVCDRVFKCTPIEVKDSAQFRAVYGQSETECKPLLYANPGAPLGLTATPCDQLDTDQELCANLGQPEATKFSVDREQSCFDRRAELNCTDYLAQLQDPSLAPTACFERCE